MRTVRYLAAVTVITGLALVGCVLTPPGMGRVVIGISTSGGARTILPTISVASYRISFSGPASHDPVVTTEATVAIELEAGTWRISVEGLDADGDTVAVGEQSGVEVSAGLATPVSIVLSAQASGSGTIDVTVNWPGTLQPAIGTVEVTLDGGAVPGGTVSFTPGGSTMSYLELKAAGSYVLCIVLRSGATLRASVTEAVQVYGNLTSSATIALTMDDFTSAPAAPSSLAVAEGLAQLELSWVDASDVETGYVVERGTAEAGPFAVLDGSLPVNTEHDVDASVTAGTTYWYRVKATNAVGDSAYAGPASGKVEGPTPGGGGVLTYSEATTSSIRVSWQKAIDNASAQAALEYKVVRSLSDNIQTVADAEDYGTPVTGWTTDVSTAVATGLSAGTQYWFNVLVRDAAGNPSACLSSAPSGSIGLTITVTNPQDQTITFDQTDDIVIAFGSILVVTVSEGFGSYGWILDGSAVAGQTAASVSLDSGSMAFGVHHLVVLVSIDERAFSKSLRFFVEN